MLPTRKILIIILMILVISGITTVIVKQIYTYKISDLEGTQTPVIQHAENTTQTEALPVDDCLNASLSQYEQFLCTEAKAAEADSDITETYNSLTFDEKMNFDCSKFQDVLTESNCKKAQEYSKMMIELRRGNVEYCETAFLMYGEMANHYANECKVAYVVDFTASKDCTVLEDSNLMEMCEKSLTRQKNLLGVGLDSANRAYLEKDISICSSDIGCIDTYYLLIAKEAKDIVTCDNIEGKGLKAQCQYSIALESGVINNDISSCDLIIQESLRDVCKEKIIQMQEIR